MRFRTQNKHGRSPEHITKLNKYKNSRQSLSILLLQYECRYLSHHVPAEMKRSVPMIKEATYVSSCDAMLWLPYASRDKACSRVVATAKRQGLVHWQNICAIVYSHTNLAFYRRI